MCWVVVGGVVVCCGCLWCGCFAGGHLLQAEMDDITLVAVACAIILGTASLATLLLLCTFTKVRVAPTRAIGTCAIMVVVLSAWRCGTCSPSIGESICAHWRSILLWYAAGLLSATRAQPPPKPTKLKPKPTRPRKSAFVSGELEAGGATPRPVEEDPNDPPLASGILSRAPMDACPLVRPWEARTSDPRNQSAARAPAAVGSMLLPLLDDRAILFVGDSMALQHFVAFGCMLLDAHAALAAAHGSALSPPRFEPQWWAAGTDGVLKKRCQYAARCHYSEACLHLRSTRICVCSWMAEPLTACLDKYKFNASTDVLVAGTRAVHLLNSVRRDGGGHLDKAEASSLAVAEVNATLTRLAARLVVPRRRRQGSWLPALVWREATAQHFEPAGGHFDISADLGATNEPRASVPCVRHAAAEMARHAIWNRAAAPLLASAGVPVVPVWRSTSAAWDGHVGRGDCTHYVMPGVPDEWARLLAETLLSAAHEEASLRHALRARAQASSRPRALLPTATVRPSRGHSKVQLARG